MSFTQLTAGQVDALKEISNIGMGHAATALSQLLRDRVMLQVPKVTITEFAQVPEQIGGPENIVVGVTLRILGDAQGSILLIFPRESALLLLESLLGPREAQKTFNDMEVSTLQEVGNILASAYLSALGGMLGISLIPSVPALACDMAGAVVDHVLIELGRSGDLALMLETEFYGPGPDPAKIKGHFFVLPDPDSLQIVLQALGSRS